VTFAYTKPENAHPSNHDQKDHATYELITQAFLIDKSSFESNEQSGWAEGLFCNLDVLFVGLFIDFTAL
jgi:hypothetical protein